LANQSQRLGLLGAQKFFKNESSEELEHYQTIVDFINDRGSVAETPTIEAIEETIDTLESALTFAYNAEVELGNKYSEWYSASEDPIVSQFLLQFIEIQRKSIGFYADLLQRLSLGGDILVFDSELGTL
jgi:ferritin